MLTLRSLLLGHSSLLPERASCCWKELPAVGKSSPLLGRAPCCWEELPATGESSLLLGRASCCWEELPAAGKSSLLLERAPCCWKELPAVGKSSLAPVAGAATATAAAIARQSKSCYCWAEWPWNQLLQHQLHKCRDIFLLMYQREAVAAVANTYSLHFCSSVVLHTLQFGTSAASSALFRSVSP